MCCNSFGTLTGIEARIASYYTGFIGRYRENICKETLMTIRGHLLAGCAVKSAIWIMNQKLASKLSGGMLSYDFILLFCGLSAILTIFSVYGHCGLTGCGWKAGLDWSSLKHQVSDWREVLHNLINNDAMVKDNAIP